MAEAGLPARCPHDWLPAAFKWGYDKAVRASIAAAVAAVEPGVTLRTLDEWLADHPEVVAEIERGRREKDLEHNELLETAALGMAIGGPGKTETVRVPNGKGGATVTEVVTPGRPPDGKLALDILERRSKERWDKKAAPPPPPVSKQTIVVLNGRMAERGMRSIEDIVAGVEKLEPPVEPGR